MGFHWGDPETTALKSLSIARSEKLFIFGLTYCEGLNNYLITRKTIKRSTVYIYYMCTRICMVILAGKCPHIRFLQCKCMCGVCQGHF
jgi:hypothetical protein